MTSKNSIKYTYISIIVTFAILSIYQYYVSRSQLSYSFDSSMPNNITELARAVWFKKYLIGAFIGFFYLIASFLIYIEKKRGLYIITSLSIMQVIIFLLLRKIGDNVPMSIILPTVNLLYILLLKLCSNKNLQ